MDEYIKYYDDKINKNYFDQDVEMSSNTAHNPENPMEFESITEQFGNLNLSEQTHQINSSANNIKPKEEAEDHKMVDEDINQDEEEEQNNFYPPENDIESSELLNPPQEGDDKMDFYPEFAKVETNQTLSSHHYTEHITTEFSEQSSHQTQIIEPTPLKNLILIDFYFSRFEKNYSKKYQILSANAFFRRFDLYKCCYF